MSPTWPIADLNYGQALFMLCLLLPLCMAIIVLRERGTTRQIRAAEVSSLESVDRPFVTLETSLLT